MRTAIYTDISGSNWPIVYFVSYWIITVLIMLNLIISFVLEIYSSVEGETLADHQKLMYAKTLVELFPDDDKFLKYVQHVMSIGYM